MQKYKYTDILHYSFTSIMQRLLIIFVERQSRQWEAEWGISINQQQGAL